MYMYVYTYIYIYIRWNSSREHYTIRSKVPFRQTPAGLSTLSMFGRALHRQLRVGSPQTQEQVLRPAGVRHICKRNLYRFLQFAVHGHYLN